jgi:hypothetical protein
MTPKNQPSVVSPPCAPNLNVLFTGHVGQDGDTLTATKPITNDTGIELQAKDTVKSPMKKKLKKLSLANMI